MIHDGWYSRYKREVTQRRRPTVPAGDRPDFKSGLAEETVQDYLRLIFYLVNGLASEFGDFFCGRVHELWNLRMIASIRVTNAR